MAACLPAWQHPFLNVFRHFKVDEWKRSAKEGDVATVTDKTLKCTVYRVRGSVSAGNYIQLPKTSTQSLGLTGRYLYVLFRPLPPKHFVIHLDVSTEDSQVIRVSLSNLFKEFKSTVTWLQFPFICEAGTSKKDLAGVPPTGARWTCLQLDLHDILLVYLNRRYGHLKGVRLCANLLVRSLYTSDLCFDPAVTATEARRAKLPVTPMPREMAFPVSKGESWHDRYIHIRFPSYSSKALSKPVQKSCVPPEAGLSALCSTAGFPGHVPRLLSHLATFSKPTQDSVSPVVQMLGPTASCRIPSAPRPLPEVSLFCEHSEISSVGGPSGQSQEPSAWEQATDKHATGSSIHVSAHELAVVPVAPEDVALHEPPCRKQSGQEAALGKNRFQQRSFLPDPILRLKGVIGFGGHSTKWALWTKDGAAVVYPCHAVIVVLNIESREQRFFLGHTEKVSALALDGSSSLLASAQARPPSMLRLWDFQTGGCLSLFRSPVHTICSLSFSDSGALLCGTGKDRHGRTVVVAWGTDQVGRGGKAVVLAKVHTDVDIQGFEVAFFDETRMVSCGQGSVRLWRLRHGGLRSCPVDLGEYHALEFTDLAFGQDQDGCTLYVCGRSGHILEVDYQRMAVRHARRLLPMQTPSGPLPQKQTFSSGPGIAISSLSVSQTMCAVGSEDGYLRLWPLDFSSVLLEAEHEGPISSVRVSPDGLRVLSTTSSGHLGFLDVLSREYHVLVRSHTAPVLALATKCSQEQLATVSQDHTVRVWDLVTLQQLYDFTSPEEAPCTIAFHPTQPTFFCGFSGGAVRSFSLEATEVLVEHRCHRGAVIGLAASPDGSLLFSSCSQGTLAQYHCAAARCRLLRVAANVVCQDAHPSPNALAVSRDSYLLAFVGPSKYTVTIMDTASLDKLLQVDVSALGLASSRLDSAVAVCFGPAPPSHLLVSMSSNVVVVLDATSGRTVRELSSVHPAACPSLALSGDGRFLLTAADRAIKVWDYLTRASPGCQMYIGHSEPVQAVAFTPNQQQLLSVGDAIFLWDILVSPERSPPGSIQGSPGGPPTCEAGPGARQPEDTVSGADGLPRRQVPVPSQTAPPWLGACVGPPEGGDGTFCVSDDERPSEESHGPKGLRQASASAVLLKEADGATDGAWGAAVDSWGLGVPPHPCGQPNAQSTRRTRARPATYPDSYKPFTACCKASPLAKSVSFPPASGEWLRLKAVVGYSGNGRANVVWRPDTGFFAYACGCLVVVEDLHSGAQQHWLGHPEEISTLALSHDAQVLASASGRSSTASHCQICIWDVSGGSCRQLVSHHDTAVRALAFSPDDGLLVTLGDYGDCTLALWSMSSCELLSSTRLPEPVHGVAFNPWHTGELACVGQGAVTLWLLQRHGADISLQAHRERIPEEVGVGELTSLCYGAAPLLYCGSSTGQVCVWDTHASRCFLAWEADDGEIGVLLCSGAQLVSGSSTRRLRLWAVGAVPELRRKGSGARSSSVFMERELTLDGAIVGAVFHDSTDMGVVGTAAGTLWYVSWAEGTSTRLVSGHSSKVNEVVFSPSESYCATCGDDGSVRVWSLVSMELVIQFQVLNQSCLCLAWSPPSCGRPDQQQVVAGYSDGTLRVFSISRTSMDLKMRPCAAALTAIAFSADGQTILSGDKDGLVAVSRPCTGMTLRVLSDHRGAPISAIQTTSKEYGDFGVEGTDLWLAVSGDQRVSVWASDWLRDRCELVDWLSFPAPALMESPGCPPPSLAAFCPWDGALLVCAGLGVHRDVVFYSLRQKQVVEKIPLPFFAVSLSLSPGARLVAVGFAEHVLRLVDCASGATQDFAGHVDSVQLCRFTPSARLLFTAAHNEILVWEVTRCCRRGRKRPLWGQARLWVTGGGPRQGPPPPPRPAAPRPARLRTTP
ncbi:PREDICTED: WD repeat-containing protein 90 [Ceratotherium simum simum]|uniref:WD repeat-containing protein 90 n=1 Tax=Ceratotherium simum simum TaxID=73337 RepID=A0ABM1DAS2_CERSS|nr:PREDICTED: WD repeat-containing protein 90 [Ceratotherium simum simum]